MLAKKLKCSAGVVSDWVSDPKINGSYMMMKDDTAVNIFVV